MKSRILFICTFLFFTWIILIVRVAFLQVLPNEKLELLQKKKFETVVTLFSRRGAILDRKGRDLAVTIPAYSLYADPQVIKDQKINITSLGRKLSRFLKINRKELLKKISSSSKRFVWIKRRLDSDMMKEIKSWHIRGLGFIEEPKRLYPNETVLAQILGFVGSDGEGLEGLEFEHNDILRGNNKRMLFPRDARGRPLIVNGKVLSQNPEGSHLTLTIDRELQYAFEQYLSKAVKFHKAKSAMGIVLEAQDSAILAMANVPLYNANRALKYSSQIRRTRTIVDSFEPGSTFKIFTLAAGLKKGVLDPEKRYFCENGKFQIGNRFIREAHQDKKWTWLTPEEILLHSSNIGTTKIAFDVGEKYLRQILSDFGFGSLTGVDFPGEQTGTLLPLPWKKHLFSNISFGQGVSATALQMANAYSTIANGGFMKRPHILKSIYDSRNKKSFEVKYKTSKRILSQEQAHALQKMLIRSAAPQAQIDGFVLGGKTGTAQKVKAHGKGYEKKAYISSYIGLVPGYNPQYVVYVSIDHPQNKQYYGAEVAAPVFAQITRFLIRQAGLSPEVDLSLENKKMVQKTIPIKRVLSSKKKSLKKRSSHMIKARKYLTLPQLEIDISSGLTPSLYGLTLREVFRLLKNTPLQIEVYGQGRVVKTSPKAGDSLPQNKTISVYFEKM